MTEQNEPVLEQETIDVAIEAQSFGGEWLPSWKQMENALRLRFDWLDASIDTEDTDVAPDIAPDIAPDSVYYASMRQGMGMVLLAGIVAGFIPFIWSWISSARFGAAVPLASLGAATDSMYSSQVLQGDNPIAVALQTIAGLQPAFFPGWLASGVSAFGLWLNTPLEWLAAWIVYGLLVLLIAKVMGAGTTLQQFYTVTSYAFLPLVLTALSPIPCLGLIIWLFALIWAAAVYTVALRSVSGLSTGISLLCVLLPGITIALIAMAVAAIVAASVVSLVF